MANYLTTDTELTSIADAIRTKGGTQADLVYPTGFVSAINDIQTGGGGGPFTLSGDCSYTFYADSGWDLFNNFTISTNNIKKGEFMFDNANITTIPFSLNFAPQSVGNISFTRLFSECYYLTALPTINVNNAVMDTNGGFNYMFGNCQNIEAVPDFIGNNIDLASGFYNTTSQKFQNMFVNCHNLKTISSELLGKLWNNLNNTNRYNNMFYNCYSLTAINNFAAFGDNPDTVISSNVFNTSLFASCSSCSSITFSCNGAVRKYSNQEIRLTGSLGFATNTSALQISNFTGGSSLADSVYDHNSLVETITSLPDTSSVSPPANPNNKLTIQNGLGANSVNGGVNDLTAEEIAVATNKGWALNYIG